MIGPSGAGKSCLARVLVGIWKPRRGAVMLGNTDLAHWNQDDLGVHLGYVPQEVDLLPGTAAENISRFATDVTENSEALLEACEKAGILDLIKGLPEGFNTPLGPGGHVLSGGQRQRVALARALYGRPKLVVMDEPNSNLDAIGEQALASALERLRRENTTVVIVTHKVGLLSFCDDVLVLNAGAVQAFGTREQIVNRLPRQKAPPSLTVIEGRIENRSA
ncbi:ATP-binding cassette domain-containing protein [Micromonospora sp. STR1s_5]|nr:ATP-binding cassette domain-containing protein [Micromonospora sp. STR1s_5]